MKVFYIDVEYKPCKHYHSEDGLVAIVSNIDVSLSKIVGDHFDLINKATNFPKELKVGDVVEPGVPGVVGLVLMLKGGNRVITYSLMPVRPEVIDSVVSSYTDIVDLYEKLRHYGSDVTCAKAYDEYAIKQYRGKL